MAISVKRLKNWKIRIAIWTYGISKVLAFHRYPYVYTFIKVCYFAKENIHILVFTGFHYIPAYNERTDEARVKRKAYLESA